MRLIDADELKNRIHNGSLWTLIEEGIIKEK